ncbi:polyphosphate kinase 1 [Solitalea canadensis]|uniref:Polyphosphate kinase n=1 Tax=Solitalea canadensis (strain ATCC 29591 / DSM 3403 / JCM 21819 / LMG 8368 / NBRC 15130 / NCIMB 12057 / USAM 9D) TaxID=929556 RepID=H8KVN1_SOLCM|nr:polyphosphate kinase 1 [Solitalea canadensis]AFD06534.1 polyphosphate kinase 1 [Solitalea canadensis DSM 3403]
MTPVFFDRDLSWLLFNYRVLQEAQATEVPVYERIKFLSIYSSNLDEFFRVRMPVLLATANIELPDVVDQIVTNDLLKQVQLTVSKQQQEFGATLIHSIIPELKKHHVFFNYGKNIPDEYRDYTRDYFFTRILSFLHPVFLNGKSDFLLENNCIYFALLLKSKGVENSGNQYALVNIPSTHLPRFVSVRSSVDFQLFFIDDIIRDNFQVIFPDHEVLECCSIKITRNAELNIIDEFSPDIAELLQNEIEKRDFGVPTRFLYEEGISETLLNYLQHFCALSPNEMFAGGRYHNLKDLANLPNPIGKQLEYETWPAQHHPELKNIDSIFTAIDKADQLIHLPYQSYDYILRFFNEAAIDPSTEELFVTLYRIAADSYIANALIGAAKNGKKVTVFVELKARFDEANNIRWAKKMKAAGVKIVYSIPGLKVHAKIALVHKKSGLKHSYYGLLATGNFNEATARFYCDQVLMTTNKDITKELDLLFAYLQSREQPSSYNFLKFEHLLVAQFNLQQRFELLIDREIEHVKQGRKGRIVIKLNNLQERNMIVKLYEASCAGVKIDLIIRSICCLVPGITDLSENISITRIVDRYLEHSRIFYFANNGEDELFMGSADWMNRNLHSRIEVCFPVLAVNPKEQVKQVLKLQLKGNSKAVVLGEDNTTERLHHKAEERHQSQAEIYDYVKLLKKSS